MSNNFYHIIQCRSCERVTMRQVHQDGAGFDLRNYAGVECTECTAWGFDVIDNVGTLDRARRAVISHTCDAALDSVCGSGTAETLRALADVRRIVSGE